MNTVLQARPRNFVSTPTLERTTRRTLRYLQSGYSVHLKGPAGTGKTTLALHLADLLGRPIMLLFGDDEFKTSDLIGNQSGYTRKKVVDNFIHSVMKVEDELRHNWIDSRLTLACREGFTLVYDEFNRSRPEVNNVLLSALEEKLLVLPPNNNRAEYIRVSPHFRAIFTSNPEEYCGVHGTQDALQDRLITINMPEPDELAQQQILVQKIGIDPAAALQIVHLVKAFQGDASPDAVSSLRPSLMIATICHEHGIIPLAENAEFRDLCSDVLLDRAKDSLPTATQRLWDLFNQFVASPTQLVDQLSIGLDQAQAQPQRPVARLHGEDNDTPLPFVNASEPATANVFVIDSPVADELAGTGEILRELTRPPVDGPPAASTDPDVSVELIPELEPEPQPEAWATAVALEPEREGAAIADGDIEGHIFDFLEAEGAASLVHIEAALGLTRFQVFNALKSLLDQGLVEKQDHPDQPSTYQTYSS
ncbi:MAG: gas vesicle protein GvpN [Nodosilinea sp.]